eukprot:m.627399 g.627399  ORF g.627399 m.627399 type:complete len:312 (-) comp22556_c0_seq10:220-1155(-)
MHDVFAADGRAGEWLMPMREKAYPTRAQHATCLFTITQTLKGSRESNREKTMRMLLQCVGTAGWFCFCITAHVPRCTTLYQCTLPRASPRHVPTRLCVQVKAMLPLTPAVRAQLDAAAVTQCMGMQSNTDEPLTSVWLPGVGQGKLGQEWNAATGVSYIPLSVVCKGNIAEICNGAVVDRDTAPPDMCTDLNAHEAPGAEYRASQNPTAPPHAATRTAPAHPPRWRGDAGPPQGPPPGPPPAQGRQAPPAQFGGAYGGAPPPRPPVHAPSAPGPNSGMATYERAPGSSLAPGGEEPRSRKRKSRWSDTRPV